MTLTIDAAQPADAPQLALILSDWIDQTPWMPRLHSRDADRAHVTDLIRSGGVLTARRDGTPVGFLFERDCHLGALYLDPSERGKGLGKRLLDRLKEECDTIGLWTFEANEPARRFYEREGFRVIERTEGDNPEGLPDIRMFWDRETAHA